MTMDVHLYDSVILTNGCQAAIVGILDSGKKYLADVSKKDTVETEEIYAEDMVL